MASLTKTLANRRRRRTFFGWRIAWAGCGLYCLNALAFTYGYSLFVEPLSQEFGWSRSAISAVWSATLGVGMLSALPAGWAIDRWGPRVVALLSIPLVAIGWFGVTFIQQYWSFFVAFAGLIGLALQPALVMAGQAAVNEWFQRDRGLAFAILSQGAGLAGLLGVPILGWCLSLGEWRLAARLLASLILIVGMSLSLTFRPRPKSYDALSDGGGSPDPEPTAAGLFQRLLATQRRPGLLDHSYSPSEARAMPTFWLLMGVYFSRFVGMGVVTLHLVPYLQQQGFSTPMAGFTLGLGLAASLPGRFVSGWAADRFTTRRVLAFCLIFQAFSLVPIMLGSGQGGLYLYAVLWGLGLGSENLIHSIRAEYFGRQYFGIISGYFTWPQMLGRMSGAVIGGITLDLLRSYLGAFLVAASLFALAAAVALVTNPPVCRRPSRNNRDIP